MPNSNLLKKMSIGLTLSASLLVLSACGGGGGFGKNYETPDFEPAPTAEPTYGPEPTPTPTPLPTGDPTPPLPIVNGGLEAGSTAPWGVQGATTIAVNTDTVHTGTYSLLAADRGDGWHGPTYSLTGILEDSREYSFKAYVRLSSPAEADISLTAKIELAVDAYVNIGTVTASDSEWAEISGRLVTAGITEETPITLYFESPVGTASFYVDDLSGEITTALPLVNRGLEDSSTDAAPWTPRGSGTTATVDTTVDNQHGGKNTLLIADRADTWHGGSYMLFSTAEGQEVTYLDDNTEYEISAFAKMAAPASETIKMSAEVKVEGADTDYPNVDSSIVTDEDWVELKGEFVTGDLTTTTQVLLYFEANTVDSSYYLDDLRVAKLLPNLATNGNLETSATDLSPWANNGGGTVSINTGTVYRGSNSLLISDRSATWQGAAYPVLSLVEPNKDYEVSAWVRMASPASSNIKFSTKTTTGGVDSYGTILEPTEVTDGEWIQLLGTMSIGALTDTTTDLIVYLESDDATASYYIDNLRVSELK